MNKYSKMILWIGLILILLNLFMSFGSLKSVLFGGGSGTGPNIGKYGNSPAPTGKTCPSGYTYVKGICYPQITQPSI